MPVYDFNATQLAAKKFDPQLTNLGMIEFFIDKLIPLGRDSLRMGLQRFELPNPRQIQEVSVKYLNGVIKYPGAVQPIGDLSIDVVDYYNGTQRGVLHRWFDMVYDERTGLGMVPSRLKVSAAAMMFSPDGLIQTQYLMEGVWPKGDAKPASITFDGGGVSIIPMTFSVDFIKEMILNGIVQDTSSASAVVKNTSNILKAPTN